MPDEVSQARRHEEVDRVRHPDRRVGEDEPTRSIPVLEEVIGEQRVPCGLRTQGARDRVDITRLRRRDADPHQLGEIVAIESVEHDAIHSVAGPVGQRLPYVVGHPVGRIPHDGHQQHRRRRHVSDDVAQEVYDRRFGPLQVIDHDHRGSATSRPRHDVGDGVEQEVASCPVVAGRRGRRGDAASVARQEADEISAVTSRVGVQLDVGHPSDDPLDDHLERLEGGVGELVAPSVVHVPVAGVGDPSSEVGQQRRLADADLPRDEHDAGTLGGGPLGGGGEELDRGASPDTDGRRQKHIVESGEPAAT